MAIKQTSYKATALFFSLLMASTATAAETLKPLILTGRYAIAWSGIPLGRIILEADEDAHSYRMSIDTKTHGVGALLSDDKSIAMAEGTKPAEGVYIPTRYDSRPQKNQKGDIVTLTYDTKGNLIKNEQNNPDDPAWRPTVPRSELAGAYDPITAAFTLRHKLHAALQNDTAEISTRMYDGLHLATMRVIRASNARVAIMDKYIDTVNVAITRTPINGYTPKELKKYKNDDPEIRLYFSNDEAFIPVRGTAKVLLGELSMTLEKIERQ